MSIRVARRLALSNDFSDDLSHALSLFADPASPPEFALLPSLCASVPRQIDSPETAAERYIDRARERGRSGRPRKIAHAFSARASSRCEIILGEHVKHLDAIIQSLRIPAADARNVRAFRFETKVQRCHAFGSSVLRTPWFFVSLSPCFGPPIRK